MDKEYFEANRFNYTKPIKFIKDLINVHKQIFNIHDNQYFYRFYRFYNKKSMGYTAKKTKINYKITLPSIKNTQDFLGINYYSRDLIRFSLGSANPIQLIFNRKNKNTDLGWEIFPTGIYTILEDAHELYPELPIFITENGIADKKDKNRNSFINDHLNQIYNAIKIGIPVKGYCHWSLLDNFEWAEGFHPRFGLYEVNYETFERTPRPSALYYKSIIERNGLNQDDKY